MGHHVGVLITFIFLLAGCSQPAVTTEPPITDDDPNAAADVAMTALIDKGFHGSVLVACGDEILISSHYGVDPGDRARVTRYWVASVTKALTAIAVDQTG